jgi:L-threonylcarbamoyladenylate synthase
MDFFLRLFRFRGQTFAVTEQRHAAVEILQTHTPALFDAAVSRAVELLRAGEPVALPTETVYGLAANALDARAVARIFAVKGRPSNNPVIVHVASLEMARRCVATWPVVADRLAHAFWPGPLTVVLSRSREIPDTVTAGGPTVGVRWPGHPFIQAVIRECNFPLAAPSANLSSQVSPTNAHHVLKGLGDKIRLIVDGGQSQVGIESTVLDLTVMPPRVLRPGMIHDESLLAVTGELQGAARGNRTTETLRSPGLLPKHYAPKAKLVILSWHNELELLAQLSALEASLPKTHIIVHTRIPSGQGTGRVSVIPHEPEALARAIYAELHRCEEEGARLIVVEALPETTPWQAINDRLRRAAA